MVLSKCFLWMPSNFIQQIDFYADFINHTIPTYDYK
jgi:hypothetical protein